MASAQGVVRGLLLALPCPPPTCPGVCPPYSVPARYLGNHSSLECLKTKVNAELRGAGRLVPSSRGSGGHRLSQERPLHPTRIPITYPTGSLAEPLHIWGARP